jgi:galactokinase
MTRLEDSVRARFNELYGRSPELVVLAPGRVNLIGEHTDYNDGFVLPCAINYHTLIAAAPRADRTVRVSALDYGGHVVEFSLDDSFESSIVEPWVNYVRGSSSALSERGQPLVGADLVIAGNIPRGAGLSSSASLSVGVIETLAQLSGISSLSPSDVALLAQRAENAFVGVQCGIMDQLASARGQAGSALRIDCRSLEVTPVPIPSDLVVLVVNSGVQRGLVKSKYNDRRNECAAAAAHYGVGSLRDLTLKRLIAERAGLDDVLFNRAHHVISENLRVDDMIEALHNDDRPWIGALMAASHRSMRDDFEISVPKVNELVDILASAIGEEGGARMTGGGFGGCVVALLPKTKVEMVQNAVASLYRTPDGKAPQAYVCEPSEGAHVIGAGGAEAKKGA